MTDALPVRPTVHFIAFRGEEYHSAVRIWGKPGIIHRVWDRRALRDIDPAVDTVVFAKGCDADEFARFNGQDIDEGKIS
ncbi:hypothetical protein [Sphingomonas sp. TREG-RG-20F-R18-01]|uniref:hypothetical protein n=1 Tax=Sphingomonas sp. TREG-RG-20F-R18-01 TaxID=2914982 RepID=UPI001F56EFD9|nr:hypothetical protein [Sphingomonas sp. TREG-RG-20F-R18-01]